MSFRFIETGKGPLVLLFYDGYEWRAREGRLANAASAMRRAARYSYRTLRRTQVFTGYYSSFRALRIGLERLGYDVRVNDFAKAREHPHYPIGVSGYPTVLDAVRLPNPAVFGPGDFGDPITAAAIAKQPNIRFLIRAGEWLRQIYLPYCGEKVVTWPSPVDTGFWSVPTSAAKHIDVLVYDKIYHDRDTLAPAVRGRLETHLDRLGLSWEVLEYGQHHFRQYKEALADARSIAFLSHHETQGRAAIEAMSCNVPVFAWDEGKLYDSKLRHLARKPVKASSVPYFDERCGVRFKSGNIEEKFDHFWSRLATFRPREFVLENFTLEARAKAYLALYTKAGASED